MSVKAIVEMAVYAAPVVVVLWVVIASLARR